MTLPFVKVEQVNESLALAPADTDQICCVVGHASAAPKNTLLAFRSLAALRSTAGFGPGVESAAQQIDENGAVYLCAPTADVVGVCGTPVEIGASPAIGTSGAPNDDYRIRGELTKSGTLGTSQIRFSLDGGNTWKAPVATAATIVLADTGVTITMSAGSYVEGDTVSIDCAAPHFSPTNFTTAANAVLADPAKREFGLMLVAGTVQGADAAAKATAFEAMATAAGAHRTNAADNFKRYYRVALEAPEVAAATLVSGFADFVDEGVISVRSPMDVQSPISQLTHKRPGGGEYAARIGRIAPQKHPGEVRQGAGKGGPLPSRVKAIYLDDTDVELLDSARFVTVRTLVDKPGFYFSNGPTMAEPLSSFSEHQFVRVIDLASKLTRTALAEWLNGDLFLKRDGSGKLTDVQADAIDADITTRVRQGTVDKGYVVDAYGKCDRTINVRDTSSLEGETGVARKGYAKFITWRVGFKK